MEPSTVINIAQEALKTTLLLSAPLLVSSLIVGVMIAVFQAVTQINEVTLTFIPKIVVIVIAVIVAAPWMLQLIMQFTSALYGQIPDYVH